MTWIIGAVVGIVFNLLFYLTHIIIIAMYVLLSNNREFKKKVISKNQYLIFLLNLANKKRIFLHTYKSFRYFVPFSTLIDMFSKTSYIHVLGMKQYIYLELRRSIIQVENKLKEK